METHLFLEPLDVLFLRGNRLFGDPGSYGESLVPPWPSVVAGALRSALLAADGTPFEAFAAGALEHPVLGSPGAPREEGFRITRFQLGRRRPDGEVEGIHPLPADLVVTEPEEGSPQVSAMAPAALPRGVQCSMALARVPVLPQPRRAKPASGWWLTEGGWARYLRGEAVRGEDLVRASTLWRTDERVGVGLDRETRRASDGRLFTVQAVAFVQRGHPVRGNEHEGPEPEGHDVGFLVGVAGEADLSGIGAVRLGGDGRAAAVRRVEYQPPAPDCQAICTAGRCRIVLTSPGIFPEGWRLPGMAADGAFTLGGVRGRVVAAAVPRHEVISGWNLARGRPKVAERAAPAGSVYWLDGIEATPETLRGLAARGLWPEQGYDAGRRVEGFNRFEWGVWR